MNKWNIQRVCSLLICLLFMGASGFGQTLVSNYGAPATPVQVANGNATFKIKILGGAAACAGPTALNVTLPTGYVYVSGSASVTAGSGTVSQTSASNNTAVLSVAGIPAGPDSTVITYQAYAGCGAIGGSGTTVTYAMPAACGGPASATTLVNAQNAQLNITNITNNAYSGAGGSTYNRAITITNGGIGQIDTIYLNSTNTNLTITGFSVNTGTITATANGYRIVSPTTDGHLGQNETIVVTETVKLSNCSAGTTSGTTNYKVFYGPNGTECTAVSNTATAGATITPALPNITVTSISGQNISCFGQDYNEQVRIVNSGTGTASSFHFNIYPAAGSPFNASTALTAQRFYAVNSFTYKIGSAGTLTPLIIDSATTYTTPAPCADANLMGNVYLTLPSLNPGDTLFLNYIDKNCCLPEASYCSGGGVIFPGSGYRYNYVNPCGTVVNSSPGSFTGNTSAYLTVNPNFPGSIVYSSPGTLRYDVSSASLGMLLTTGSTLTLTWTFPANLSFSGLASDLSFLQPDGSTAVTPSSVNYNAASKTLTVTFNNFNYATAFTNGGSFVIRGVSADCTNGSAGPGQVSFKALFTMGCGSGCSVPVACSSSATVNVICACTSTTGGMNAQNFTLLRTSYGLPDNNNDRIADGSGSINESLIRRDLVFTGDTVKASLSGKVIITASSPAFSNGYASVITNTGEFQVLYANLKIYRGGTLVVNAPNYPVDTAQKMVDFSPVTLASRGYTGYTFTDGDSVVVDQYLQVSYYSSSSNPVLTVSNRFYLSNIPNPVQETDKYNCPVSIPQNLGYVSVGLTPVNSFLVNSYGCDTASYNVTRYVSTRGTNATIYNNVFPYEVRPSLQPDTILVKPPVGYTYAGPLKVSISRPFNASSSQATSFNLDPVAMRSDTMVFVVPAASVPPADETDYSGITTSWVPSCGSPASTTYNVSVIYNPPAGYPGARQLNSYTNTLTHTSPSLNMITALPTVTTAADTAVWEVQLTNPAASPVVNAANAWLGKNGVSGLTIASVEQLSGAGGTVTATLSPSNGVYPLGLLASGTTRYYRIKATSANCVRDSFSLAYGYNCGGYPASVGDAACKQSLTLGVIRQTPALQLAITTQPSGTVNLCDPITYELDVVNSGLGTAQTLSVLAQLPSSGGISYVPGTFGIKSPASAATYTSLADGNVTVNGTNMILNIPAATLASLPGAGTYRITFQMKTEACAFTSGEKLVFRPAGRNACNTLIQGTSTASNRINLNGVPPVVPVFNITSSATPVQACGGGTVTSTYTFKLISTGTVLTTAADGFRIQLPSGWTMNTGSVSYSRPPASGGGYNTSPAAGVYDFYAGTGLPVGDSIVFTATLQANAASLACGNTDPVVENGFIQFTATCLSGTPVVVCDMKQLLDPENRITTINVQRPGYSFGVVTGTGNGTHVQGNVTLTHTNSTFVAQNITLSLYNDVNANGIYDAGEPLLGSSSYVLTNTASQAIPYDITTNVAANGRLNMILVGTFGCACDTLQYSLANIALPIEFSRFDASVNGCAVTLNWDYKATDMPLTGFEVQRTSAKGGNWTLVGKAAADQYSYTDEVPSSGSWLYRLRAVAGIKSAYTKQVFVQSDCRTGSVAIYPSPAKDYMYIQLTGSNAADAMYTITDKLGRQVRNGKLQADSKNQVNINGLAPGIYQVQVNNGGSVTVKSIEIAQ